MKIKNISVGDSVQVKKGLVSNIFKAKQVCEVIKIDSEHEFRPDVLIQGECCLGWVNHNDIKKPIQRDSEPQLKQLDQSVFKEWADCWKFFAIDEDGDAWRYREKPKIDNGDNRWSSSNTVPLLIGTGYDTSNWQNSLIERDIAKELLEVDLSIELTGSELCKAMLARGDKYVLCQCWDSSYADIEQVVDVINGFECTAYKKLFAGNRHNWEYATPINNQGEPLTASEAGL